MRNPANKTPFMLQVLEASWWIWAASAALAWAWLAGLPQAGPLLGLLSAAQAAAFAWRAGRVTAFPVQVRTLYSLLVAVAAWPPTHGLAWVIAIGTTAQVVFGYCFLARVLSLAAWNRHEPLSASLIRRTFFSPPRPGNILQGLPLAREA